MGTGIGAAAALGLGYSAGYEVRAFTLREVEVPGLAREAQRIRVLHLSDLHLMPSQHKKQRWLSSLAATNPDLIIATGDFIASAKSIAPLADVLKSFAGIPSYFVFGSNDYYGPKLKNPARYLFKDKGVRIHDDPLPTEELRAMLVELGWVELTHRRAQLELRGVRFELRGVDDPHLGLDDYATVAGPVAEGCVGIGVTHAPYLRVLDAMVADGCELIFAGHTHGGQLRLPGYGALVTNCDLDRARARGLSNHPWPASADAPSAWLHVSAGCGTNPYTPVRFACRPEATLLTLTAG